MAVGWGEGQNFHCLGDPGVPSSSPINENATKAVCSHFPSCRYLLVGTLILPVQESDITCQVTAHRAIPQSHVNVVILGTWRSAIILWVLWLTASFLSCRHLNEDAVNSPLPGRVHDGNWGKRSFEYAYCSGLLPSFFPSIMLSTIQANCRIGQPDCSGKQLPDPAVPHIMLCSYNFFYLNLKNQFYHKTNHFCPNFSPENNSNNIWFSVY